VSVYRCCEHGFEGIGLGCRAEEIPSVRGGRHGGCCWDGRFPVESDLGPPLAVDRGAAIGRGAFRARQQRLFTPGATP
jgi:hypothetical protein